MESLKQFIKFLIGGAMGLSIATFLYSITPILEIIREHRDYEIHKVIFYRAAYFSTGSKGGGRESYLNGFIPPKFNNRVEVQVSGDIRRQYEAIMGKVDSVKVDSTDGSEQAILQRKVSRNIWYNPNTQKAILAQSNDCFKDLMEKRGIYDTLFVMFIPVLFLCFIYSIIFWIKSKKRWVSLFFEAFEIQPFARGCIYFISFLGFFGCKNNIAECSLNIDSLEKIIEVKAKIIGVSNLNEKSQFNIYYYSIKGINLINKQIFTYVTKNNPDIFFMFKGDRPDRVVYEYEPKPSIPKIYHEKQGVYCHFWYNPTTQKVFMSQSKPTISSLRLDYMIKDPTPTAVFGFLLIILDGIWLFFQYRKGKLIF